MKRILIILLLAVVAFPAFAQMGSLELPYYSKKLPSIAGTDGSEGVRE